MDTDQHSQHQTSETGAAARVSPMGLPTRPGPRGMWGTALLVHARGPGFSHRTSTVFKARNFFLTPPDPCPWSPKECHLPVPAFSRAEADMRAGRVRRPQQAHLPSTGLEGPYVPRSP